MRRSDPLRTVPPPFRVVRVAVPSRAPVFAPCRPDAGLRPGTFGFGGPATPTGVEMEPQGLPGSQGTPVDLCRVLRPRPDRTHLATDGAPLLPPLCQRRGLQRVVLSGLNSTASALAVYASSSPLRCRRRKTRFRWLAKPCRVGLVTHRVPMKGFRDQPLPPFLSFSWRNDTLLTAPRPCELRDNWRICRARRPARRRGTCAQPP
jgi:hypothetical protein